MAAASTVKLWSRIHTWSSLICTVFVLMLCVTGLPLIFHDEIDELIEEHFVAPAMPAGTRQASLDDVLAATKQRYPGQFVLQLGWSEDEANVVRLLVSPVAIPVPGQFRRVAIDSRTTQVLGEPAGGQKLMDLVLKLHKDMFVGLAGELFLGFMGLVFVLAIVSGVVIYGPFMRRLDFGTVRRGGSKRLKWLDWHNLTGIVTAGWAIAVGATGTMNTLAVPLYDMWRAEVLPGLLAPYRGRPMPTQLGSIDAAVRVVRGALPDTVVTSVTLPTEGRFGSPRHYVVWAKGTTPFTARLFTPVLVDAENGELITARGPPWYVRALQVSRPLHFGDYGGLPLKIVWALLDIVTIVLLSSGLYLWFARRRRTAGSVATPVPASAKPSPAVASSNAAS